MHQHPVTPKLYFFFCKIVESLNINEVTRAKHIRKMAISFIGKNMQTSTVDRRERMEYDDNVK